MKTIFSRHGNPQALVTDNGPQLTSSEIKQFATNYGFQHITTSPYHPQKQHPGRAHGSNHQETHFRDR